MGTVIEASATAVAHHHPFAPGARKLADAAARSCLERAGRTADELDLLINVGVYHDKLMNEPALAALIQEDIGANPEHPPALGHGTFSFDISNGACGLLTGIHVVDGLLASGTVELGIVVASDTNPQPGLSERFDFPSVGGAVLLSADDSREGFTAFQFATFPEYADLLRGNIDWREATRHGLVHHGRHVLTVDIDESYAARALDCAESTVREFAVREALEFSEVDLLVANASSPGFGEELASRLGVSSELVASPNAGLSRAHTAGPAVALESARLEAGRTALFVSAAAGITVAVALYRG